MGQIVVLDQNMINMIAAGEVIERPASVVKELTENSIDAGATKITIEIEDGGRKLISVTDNGCGMDAEDLASAFESHTTSKIKTSRDLQGISTLGFRGEALASIASVAQARAVSRTKDSVEGHQIEIDCGDKGSIGPASTEAGTTIQVRDIFYKLPARRKFLKTANTEMGHIAELFTRIALANCEMDMTLIHNGRELYHLGSEDDLRQRIAKLFSSEISRNLTEVESTEKETNISALLGTPDISRTNSKLQYVFLNGRFIRDKFISHAIKEAYRGYIEPNRYPAIFLFIKMPYENYDVNVHPTKIEVRFFNTNLVHSQVLGALRGKLLATDFEMTAKLPAASFSKSGAAGRDSKIAEAMADFFKKHRPLQAQRQFDLHTKTAASTCIKPPEKSLLNAIQIHDSYIVTEADDGFIIIDQHALHERVMYERLRSRIHKDKLESQKLLIPESFKLTEAQADILKANAELIERLGIELAPFGPQTMAVQAFPVLLGKATPVDFVKDLIDLLFDASGRDIDAERLLDEVLNMAACKAAIKAGQKLNDSEVGQLLADRQMIESAGRCPHGRPTVIKFTLGELEKQFKRT